VRVLDRFCDSVQDTVAVCEHLVIPEPQDAEAKIRQVSRPAPVSFFLRDVLAAIQLDDQLVVRAAEVSDVGTDHMLPAKLGPVKLARAQPPPELSLGIRLFSAEPSRPLGELCVG
jgi:hypothetical protein